MDWIQSITRAISYIESNLTENITVSDVADAVYSSSSNFQRVFNLATGITIGDYIRNRRLSLAGQELLQPKNKIADVAEKYQYNTQESFSKAFSRFHGINPSDVRKHLNELKYFHHFTVNITIQGGFEMSNSLEILVSAQHAAMESDFISDLMAIVEPARKSNKIKGLRLISTWENYYLASAICSIGESLGAGRSGKNDFHFYAHITGDSFTHMYAADKGNPDKIPCDSGVTNYFFMPHVVKKAYAAFGYDCIYISNSQIKKDFRAVMNAIKTSVDNGVPVLAWGMGNVTMNGGTRYDPLPEGCLIGGYDENDVLYVNLYPNKNDPDRLPKSAVDEGGFCAISNGLDTTNGLFFVGKKLENIDLKQIYQDAINSIPIFLTLPVFEGYMNGKWAFGKAAFDVWADTLETDEYFMDKTDKELGNIRWNLHNSPFCSICTTHAYNFIAETVEKFPDITIATKLLPLYKHIADCKDAMWELHGGFEPPLKRLRHPKFRMLLAEIIREIGETCTDILNTFEAMENPSIKIRLLRDIEEVREKVAETKMYFEELDKKEEEEKRILAEKVAEEQEKIKPTLVEKLNKLNTSGKPVNVDLLAMQPLDGMDMKVWHENGLMKMNVDEARRVNFMATPQKFKAPLKIELRAMTSNNDIRIKFGEARLILNYASNPESLQLICVKNGKNSGVKGNGLLPTNEFVDIEWIIDKEFMSVKVNGELRHISNNYSYINEFNTNHDYRPCEQVLICAAYNSTVAVEHLRVTEI